MVTLSITSQPSAQLTAWHSLDFQTALTLLESDQLEGLSYVQVQERAAEFGSNELEEIARRSIWYILLDQFTNIMLITLIAVAALQQNEPAALFVIFITKDLSNLFSYDPLNSTSSVLM